MSVFVKGKLHDTFDETTALVAAFATTFGTKFAAGPLGTVVVETRAPGTEGTAAYNFFPSLTDDLKDAIEARVVSTGLDTDSEIEVQAIGLNTDGTPVLLDGDAFNDMHITVNYSHQESVFPSEIYQAAVIAKEVSAVPPAGFVVRDAQAPDFYNVLIPGMADEVVELIPDEIDAC